MTKKNESVIVVGSSGFSDKRIKLDGVTVDGESVKDYLDKLVIDEVVTELEEEADSVTTIYRKPRLRYKSEVEEPGKVIILTREDIEREKRISELKKELTVIDFKVAHVIAAFLTGETFTYEQLHSFIKNNFSKDIPIKQLQQKPATIKKTRINFMLKKVGTNPTTYAFDPRAKVFSLSDVYSLYQKTGISLEAFCTKYPVTLEILKDKDIDMPGIDAANGIVNADTDTDIPEVEERIPEIEELVDISDEERQAILNEIQKDEPEDRPTWQGLQGILAQLNGGKFDINININFNIGFAKK